MRWVTELGGETKAQCEAMVYMRWVTELGPELLLSEGRQSTNSKWPRET